MSVVASSLLAEAPQRRLSFAFAKRHGVLVKHMQDGVAQCACRTEERMETNRCAGTEFRTWLQSHPGSRNHAERAFRAYEHAVRARSSTRSRQSTCFQYATRRHDA